MTDRLVEGATKNNSPLRNLGKVGIGLGLLLLLAALLLPALQDARTSPRSQSCRNQLRQLALALQFYQNVYGEWPPPYTNDAAGNRLHGWRALILPYIEQRHLYESIDFSKPWDDPANAKAREAIIRLYTCPSFLSEDRRLTTYLGVVGEGCAFSLDPGNDSADDATNRPDTIAIVDVDPSRAVHWMSPEDISAEDVLKYGPETEIQHPKGMEVMFADGSAATIPLDMGHDELRGMLTTRDGR